MRLAHIFVVLAFPLAAAGCATYLDDLNRAEAHSVANENERALALFRIDESDLDSLNHADQTRYFYLRGMNDYRLGAPFRADARHWLALARAHEQAMPGGLRSEWKERLEEALKDLNQDVYGTGVAVDDDSASAKKGESKDESKDETKDAPKAKDDSDSKPAKSTKATCKKDADCEGELVCRKSRCVESK
jgi:hypothetical protein